MEVKLCSRGLYGHLRVAEGSGLLSEISEVKGQRDSLSGCFCGIYVILTAYSDSRNRVTQPRSSHHPVRGERFAILDLAMHVMIYYSSPIPYATSMLCYNVSANPYYTHPSLLVNSRRW